MSGAEEDTPHLTDQRRNAHMLVSRSKRPWGPKQNFNLPMVFDLKWR